MSKWESARAFVELALSIDKHLPGYVDAYYGSEEIRKAVEAKGKIPLEELSITLDQITILTGQDAKITKERREYLFAELNAMGTTLKILKGEEIDILEEARGLFGLSPIWTDESVFDEAHQILDDLLPGSGSLNERMENFREKTLVPKESLNSIVQNTANEFQHRTKELVSLPEGELCQYSIVQNKPWGAYNWYLGKYLSRIEINTDIPVSAGFLLHLIAHEAYPGHHTEHAIKEQKLYVEEGYLELSVLLVNTPSAVISEGIAEVALEMIATQDELVQLLQAILDQAGLHEVDGVQYYHVLEAQKALNKVSVNRILLFHSKGASDKDVIDYGMQYGLLNEKRSRKSLEFYKDPLWRSYGFLYPLGYELVKEFVFRGDSQIERFLELLQQPVTTSQLAG